MAVATSATTAVVVGTLLFVLGLLGVRSGNPYTRLLLAIGGTTALVGGLVLGYLYGYVP